MDTASPACSSELRTLEGPSATRGAARRHSDRAAQRFKTNTCLGYSKLPTSVWCYRPSAPGRRAPARCSADMRRWETVVVSNATLGAHGVSCGDLDGDGNNDLVVAAMTADAVFWHRNGGSGNSRRLLVVLVLVRRCKGKGTRSRPR